MPRRRLGEARVRLPTPFDCLASPHSLIKRLFTAWRVSHAERTERRAEREEAGEDDSEEDEPVDIPLSAVTMHPKGITAPASSVRGHKCSKREWT